MGVSSHRPTLARDRTWSDVCIGSNCLLSGLSFTPTSIVHFLSGCFGNPAAEGFLKAFGKDSPENEQALREELVPYVVTQVSGSFLCSRLYLPIPYLLCLVVPLVVRTRCRLSRPGSHAIRPSNGAPLSSNVRAKPQAVFDLHFQIFQVRLFFPPANLYSHAYPCKGIPVFQS